MLSSAYAFTDCGLLSNWRFCWC